MISEKNQQTIERLVKEVLPLKGEMAEVGVSIGDSAEVMCKLKGNRKLHLFDTWTGHPAEYIGKYDFGQVPGRHQADFETVKKRLNYKHVYFYKGIFPLTAKPIEGKKFSFVNLDTDLYQSTWDGLNFFYPRMVKGGVIIIHDMPTIPGVSCAVIDFCGLNGVESWVENNNNQAVIRI